MRYERWQQWAMGIIGLWLIISPWALRLLGLEAPPAGAAFWSTLVTGLFVALLGLGALSSQMKWEDWGDLGAGAWLIGSPWILGFSSHAGPSWNVWICGIALFILAVWGLYAQQRESHA